VSRGPQIRGPGLGCALGLGLGLGLGRALGLWLGLGRALGLAAMAVAALAIQAAPAAAALPPIHHVYVIVMENEGASTTFAPGSPAPYLSRTLRSQGAYLPNYFGTGHASNDNYIAMISGQAPNVLTQADCLLFTDFLGGSIGPYGQVGGFGCVYPSGVPNIATQMDSNGITWRDYNEDMGADAARETTTCGHPAVGGRDGTQGAEAQDAYASRHNPFVYFHSIIDDTELCNTHVVNLSMLPQDLAMHTAPNYVFITPNLCNDGHDATCKNGGPGGLAAVDLFLQKWVPQITGSWAFRNDGGLLIITFDEANMTDTASCCGEIPGPGSPSPGVGGPGGGDVGAVLLSPYIKPGTVSNTPYNHYTMLRSVEDLLGLPHLGYAQLPGETSFGSDIFACAPTVAPIASGGRLPAGSEVQQVRISRSRGQATLTLYSVGDARLRLSIKQKGRRKAKVVRRTLYPCTSYAFKLPGKHGKVTAGAYGGGGVQSATLRY
jgi:hypothetical protein